MEVMASDLSYKCFKIPMEVNCILIKGVVLMSTNSAINRMSQL